MQDMTFEATFAELEEIVGRLEGGDLTLEEAITLYERGRALARRGQALLDQAELRITEVESDDQG